MSPKTIAEKFLEKKYQLNMGAGSLAKRYGVERDDIYKAKVIAKAALNSTASKAPKILVMDIETAPLKGYVWRLWKEDVGFNRLVSDWFMLTWSAKWLFGNTVMSNRLKPKEVLAEDDGRIIKGLWELIDEADMVITHNGDRFDIPKMNTRFIVNELPPTSPYKSIDTKKIASRQFGFSSNKLDALALQFGFKPKLGTTFDLWRRCMAGEKKALVYMEKYNQHDVDLLEEVYLKLRPWIQGHPNMGMYMELDIPVCINCGSDELTYINKYYFTGTGKFETYRCKCGAIGRRRLNSFDKDKKENLLVSIG